MTIYLYEMRLSCSRTNATSLLLKEKDFAVLDIDDLHEASHLQTPSHVFDSPCIHHLSSLQTVLYFAVIRLHWLYR